MRPPARILLVLPVLLSLTAAASAPDAALVERVRSWNAPPYWWNVAPLPDAPGREALASGRQPFISGPTALPFIALPPCRLVDTRGNGAPLTGGFLPAATVRSYTLTGVCGVPANAQAISLNATAVNPVGPGFLVLYPQGGTFPPVSTLNYLGGDVIVNAAVVPLSVTGGISIALGVSGGDVVLDTNGYYAPAGVSALNGLSGYVNLSAGSNLTLTSSGNTLTVNTAPTIAANLTGNVTGNASGFTGGLSGDVTGTQGATVVSAVGGSTAANVHSAELAANAATTSNTANTIVKRDASGYVSAAGYKQPGTGGQTLRLVRGWVTDTGTVVIGSGFSVVRNSVGTYTVTFSTAFGDIPSVAITPDATVTFAHLNGGSNTAVTVVITNGAGTAMDSYFAFTAIGAP